MNQRQLFLNHVAQTTFEPMALPIAKAEGCRLYDDKGKPYIDLIGGISVSNIGHGHAHVREAVKQQVDDYMHIMVYGELIQSPQVEYAQALTEILPQNLDVVYFTNSGAEAVEGAMKLAKRYTGRSKVIASKLSYHGSTQGALSLLGDEYFRNAYRPLLPDVYHIDYNDFSALDKIDSQTAAVILEPVQAEAGVIIPDLDWLKAIREKCTQEGALLVFDEIQTGFGRTGSLFAFQKWGVVPDVLLLGKALGGGMPLGAFVASKTLMDVIAHSPILGHITTFGGHPVSCAAGKAGLEVLLKERYHTSADAKGKLFLQKLQHPRIKVIRQCGLMLAVELGSFEEVKSLISDMLNRAELGVFTDWFLFASDSFRIVPPLSISEKEISDACDIIMECL